MIMRCLAHIALVTVIQFIACYLADWGNAETVFMLFFIVLWQGLFIWLFSQIRKNGMCRMSLSLVKAFGI